MKVPPPRIKTPCPMRWDEMRGDSRSRFCERCQLQVHNLSVISTGRSRRILKRSESARMCVTYIRRLDGSMVTRADLVRERFIAVYRRTFSWFLAAFVPVAISACTAEPTRRQLTGVVAPNCQSAHVPKPATEERVIVTGGI